MGLPSLAQQAPSMQTSFQRSLHHGGHGQAAWPLPFRHLELVSGLLSKCIASYHPQLCFQVWTHGCAGIICMVDIQKEIAGLIRMALCSKRSSFYKEPVHFS